MANASQPDVPLDGPRPATVDELDEAIDLADMVFRTSQGLGPTMETEFPLLFSPTNAANLLITRAAGRVVSLTGMVVQRVVSDRAELDVACVGGVCTEPSQRGRGLGGAGLSAAVERARAAGCQLMLISGTGGLYDRVGAAPIAPVRQYMVDRYKLPEPDAYDGAMRLAAHTDNEPLAELHRGDNPRFEWRPDTLARLIDAAALIGLRVWVAQSGERLAGCLMLRPAPHVGRLHMSVVTQYVGPPEVFAPLAARAMDGFAPKTLMIRKLPAERRLESVLRKFDTPHSVRPETSALVLDLGGLLACHGERLAAGDGVKLSCEGDTLRVVAGGEVAELAEPAAVAAALFNGASRWPAALKRLGRQGRAALSQILPLPLPDYGLNYV